MRKLDRRLLAHRAASVPEVMMLNLSGAVLERTKKWLGTTPGASPRVDALWEPAAVIRPPSRVRKSMLAPSVRAIRPPFFGNPLYDFASQNMVMYKNVRYN